MEEQIGALLQSVPFIVERIVRHLPGLDIQRVSQVCRLWRKYAAIVLKERRRIVTMTGVKQDQSNIEMTIVDSPETKEFLRDLDMECGLTVMFNVLNRLYSLPPDLPSANYKAMHSCLPPSSVVIGATCISGIIGTSADGSCHEQQYPTIDCLSAFLLPKLPREGTHVTHFSLSLAHVTLLVKSELKKATLMEAFKWPKNEEAKCIVLLGADLMRVYELMINIRTVCETEIALAGGITDEVYSSAYSPDETEQLGADEDIDSDSSNNQPAYVGLIFGGENVQAVSMVIEPHVRTREGVEKRLKELKTVIEGWGECKQKIGFMFACNGRGHRLFGANDVETGIFHQLMPEIPLNGMFSYGELGWNYPPPVAPQPAKKSEDSNDAVLCHSTTIAVVGFV